MERTAHSEETNGSVKSESVRDGERTQDPHLLCCGSCLRRARALMPLKYKEEMVRIVQLAGPVFISQLMVFMISVVSTVFCGHLGKTELAGVALAIAVINVTGISIGSGLSSACDTLISQTFGSKNLKRVGVILQRGALILLLACFPCWAMFINTEPILLATRQNPDVARLSQLYVKVFMPALPAAFLYQLQGRYLQNQGIIWPQVVTGAAGNILNALINYIFLHLLDLGVAGSAAANSISQFSLAVFLYIYIRWKGLHKATWGGWSMECLQEWGSFIYLAIPSMLMLCLEWWTYEIAGFLAGLISEVELGAQSVIYEQATVAYMLPLGFSVAATVRVGNALGAGNTEQAKLSGKVSLLCAVMVSCFTAVTSGCLKNVIGYVFTTDKEIIQRVSKVMIIYSVFHIFDATAGVTGGIVRGAGKQMIGALCSLVGYYFVGFPIGVSLMFATNMGLMGLWTGFCICVFFQSAFFILLLVKLDWKKAMEEALVRAGVQVSRPPLEGRERPRSANKRVSIQTLQLEPIPEVSPEVDHADVEVPSKSVYEAGEEPVLSTIGEVLSVRQLVLRRGLAVFCMLLILGGGIAANIFLTPLLSRSSDSPPQNP
ncbi:multidrug and toxin extrusion protein 1-like [Scleropages formosus]|uniref:multidrug and toxin extrusion protein 1-like n=1 Tax=Scleropages formosus TaxID=113540 RepID=UPI000878E57C|nr:multidrug and toxin extrusion protein 1-like [Scleropages formosus]